MQREVWDFLASHLRNRKRVALLAVLESSGASPGRAGFVMSVAESGERIGTIGGGIMEVQWAERALAAIRTETLPHPVVKRLYHSAETRFEPSGLICSGWQTVLLKPLDIVALPVVQQIREAFDRHSCGRLRIGPSEFAFQPDLRDATDTHFVWSDENSWQYEQAVGVLDTVFVVGSGHVGLALCRIMATLDFRVVVFDDRPTVETFVHNTFAHQKHCCSYDRIGQWIDGNAHEYVAVVTTGYKSDEAALRALVRKNVRYIGLMGSAAKTAQVFSDLRREGIDEAFLRRIRTPIGLPIASHTPQEIAISIAAEIIQLRNRPSL
ncbi:MAG TPA: XdhC family protein [Bacteroidota bacterium]|nr:XdhC family protein [Bacteroidota bacterium]